MSYDFAYDRNGFGFTVNTFDENGDYAGSVYID